MHLFRQMNIPLILLEHEGTIRTVNQQAAASLQDKSADIPGKHILDYVYKEDREPIQKALQSLFLEKESNFSAQQNRWIIRRDGSAFLARITLSLLNDLEGVSVVLCEMIDISKTMMQDKQVREYIQSLESRITFRNKELSEKNALLALKNRELIQINKTKNTFFTNISHELRTPLVAVCGYMEMLLEEKFGPINKEIRKAFTSANDNTQRLIGFINNLLNLARVDSYKENPDYQPVTLKNATDRVLTQFRDRAREKGIRLINEIPPELPPLVIDPNHLDQILFNLISNSLKFTDQGEIKILAVELMEGRTEIQIRDTGCGIPPNEINNVFNRFYQVKRKSAGKELGSGLGLAIVKEIVSHYSGRIHIRENIGGGTIVTLEMYSPLLSREKPKRSGRILTISNNKKQNQQFRHFFSELGYRVESARTGLQAIELTEHTNYDIIFADLILPDLEGTEICTLLHDRKVGGGVPVYIVTFSINEEERNRVFLAGARGILTKPFRDEALRRIQREHSGDIQEDGILKKTDQAPDA